MAGRVAPASSIDSPELAGWKLHHSVSRYLVAIPLVSLPWQYWAAEDIASSNRTLDDLKVAFEICQSVHINTLPQREQLVKRLFFSFPLPDLPFSLPATLRPQLRLSRIAESRLPGRWFPFSCPRGRR